MKHSTSGALMQLRTAMKNADYVPQSIDAYIIPSEDSHQSEYIASCHKRRQFISGFTGSTGTAVVTQQKALLWTDGRYFLQAKSELDDDWTLMKTGISTSVSIEEWLAEELGHEGRVGVDPSLVSLDTWRRISGHLQQTNHSLVRVERNLVDVVWSAFGKPAPELSQLLILATEFAGLFNLRGFDIEFNPVFTSYTIITMDSVFLFLDKARVTSRIQEHLSDSEMKLQVLPYEDVSNKLKEICSELKKIWVSGATSASLASLVPEKQLFSARSPVSEMKAIKNEVEIEGMKRAHIRDAAALCEYFAWLEGEIGSGCLDELTASKKLLQFRRKQVHFVCESFETISASGPNGAIIHYKPTVKSSRFLSSTELYLCDSGGHYLDGTTDVTRTVHIGNPSKHEQECYTRVLKGHIQLAMAVFPCGTKGHILDVLARKPLWDCGLEYLHGTGHGIGAFLNVHEGPHGISPKVSNDYPLKAGMFVTNEPGYYEDEQFGVRLENVMLVRKVELKHNFNEVGFLGFESVTLVPFQTKMILPTLLSAEEVLWLDNYHNVCRENVAPQLKENGNKAALSWLLNETQHIG